MGLFFNITLSYKCCIQGYYTKVCRCFIVFVVLIPLLKLHFLTRPSYPKSSMFESCRNRTHAAFSNRQKRRSTKKTAFASRWGSMLFFMARPMRCSVRRRKSGSIGKSFDIRRKICPECLYPTLSICLVIIKRPSLDMTIPPPCNGRRVRMMWLLFTEFFLPPGQSEQYHHLCRRPGTFRRSPRHRRRLRIRPQNTAWPSPPRSARCPSHRRCHNMR